MENNIQAPETAPLQIRAAFSASTLNAENRTVEVVFGTDKPTRMRTWDGVIDEILSFDKAHIRMDRINSGAPLLDNHNRFGSVTDNILGVVERAWTDGKRGYATVRFAKSEKANDAMEKVRDGIIRNVSVGYSVYKYDKAPTGQRGVPDTLTAIDWEPAEISLTAVPADHGAVIRSKGELPAFDAIVEAQKEAEQNELLNQRSLEIRALLAKHIK